MVSNGGRGSEVIRAYLMSLIWLCSVLLPIGPSLYELIEMFEDLISLHTIHPPN